MKQRMTRHVSQDGEASECGSIWHETSNFRKFVSQEAEQASLASRGLRDAAQKLRVRDLFRAQTRRPMLLIIAFFFIFHASGLSGVRPYLVHVLDEYGLAFDPLWTTVVCAAVGLVATGALIAVVTRVGKRRLSLVSVAGCAASCIVLGGYAYAVISGSVDVQAPAPSVSPVNYNSTFGPDSLPGAATTTWIPLTAFIALSFFTYFGVGSIPWMYVPEVYPLRSRELASGVAIAVGYVIHFVVSKTFLQLETALRLHGVLWLYAALGIAGFVFLYLQLPETEGKTLEEIEAHFADKGGKNNAKSKSKGEEESGKENDEANDGSDGDASSSAVNLPFSYDNPLQVTHM